MCRYFASIKQQELVHGQSAANRAMCGKGLNYLKIFHNEILSFTGDS